MAGNDDICIACCEKQTNRPFAYSGEGHEDFSVILARRLGCCELKQPRPNSPSDYLQSLQPVPVHCFFFIIICPVSSIESSLIYSNPLIFKLWSKKGSRVSWKWDSSQESLKNTALRHNGLFLPWPSHIFLLWITLSFIFNISSIISCLGFLARLEDFGRYST